MTQEQVINYVVLTIVVGSLVIGLVSMLFGKVVEVWDALSAWWGQGVQKAIHYKPVKTYQPQRARVMSYQDGDDEDEPTAEPDEPRSGAFSLLNGAEPHANGSENPPELFLNAAEMLALHRMIEHNKTAAKPSKSSTIHAGFGVSRGGSEAYKRASMIYDTLFGAPPPAVKYRQRTPEQEELRKQLQLGR